jgi:dihydroorotate dehydrogenase
MEVFQGHGGACFHDIVEEVFARYDIQQSYDWNYHNAPGELPQVDVPPVAGGWDFCGIPVNSPLGIPAGPLLNSRWILYYSRLGFDVLTYKTVRSAYRASFPVPNLLPVKGGPLDSEGRELREQLEGEVGSWAISFGMPSKEPRVWMEDVARARAGLLQGQVLVVSVVASPLPGWTMDEVAADFARCAAWAKQAGAQVVEINLSCPNVCTREADLYLEPEASRKVAVAVREALGDLPLVLKVGLFPNQALAGAVIDAVAGVADAVSATNSITAKVAGRFDGLKRGIGGAAITQRCLAETEMLSEALAGRLKLISVGGVRDAADVKARLGAGAHHVQIATAAMLDPMTGVKIRAGL